MKIKGKISILINQEFTTIEIRDTEANTEFVTITLTPEQLSAALSRLKNTDCEMEVRGLDRVGKSHENKPFEFEIPKELRSSNNTEQLSIICQNLLDTFGGGWICDKYFGSQDSFFNVNDKVYARCTIRRWV